MKVLYIALGVLLLLVIVSQVFFLLQDNKIEKHGYRVVQKISEVEIREYEPALFATVTVEGNMFDTQNQAFRKLGGYIFGGNEKNQKIAMTAPVQIQGDGQNSEMKFKMPQKYTKEDLPTPNDNSVRFIEQDNYYVAAIRFGGFYNKTRYEQFKNKLKSIVEEKGLKTIDDYFFQGYNAPYQWLGRRNEVLIKINIQE